MKMTGEREGVKESNEPWNFYYTSNIIQVYCKILMVHFVKASLYTHLSRNLICSQREW
jgi:hypothetical protein